MTSSLPKSNQRLEIWVNDLDLTMLNSEEVPHHCKESMVYNIEVCDATKFVEVSPEYDKAVEVMREALEESECDCTDANHVTGLMVKDECFRCQALAAFEKAKGVK